MINVHFNCTASNLFSKVMLLSYHCSECVIQSIKDGNKF